MCWKRTFADCLRLIAWFQLAVLKTFKWRANTALRVLWQAVSILLKRCNLADENIYRIRLKQFLDYKIVAHLWWHASHNAFSNFALWPHFRHNILCGSIHCRNSRLVHKFLKKWCIKSRSFEDSSLKSSSRKSNTQKMTSVNLIPGSLVWYDLFWRLLPVDRSWNHSQSKMI